jgi:hypothetical protein
MRAFLLTIFVLGVAIIAIGGFAISWMAARQRRRRNRAASVRAAAAKFRALHGQKAEGAIARRLGEGSLSPRGRRFFKLVAAELRRKPEGLSMSDGRKAL